MQRAIFIDKDGTLIYDIPYNVDPARIRFQEGVFDSLKALKEQGYLLIMVSNQSGVAKGYFTEEQFHSVIDSLQCTLLRVGVPFDGFYFCPHHHCGIVDNYAFDCNCRKPKPGLLLQAAEDLNISLSASWMIGDILNDVEAGNSAGCRTILIDNGNETEWDHGDYRTPTYIASNMRQAAEFICSHIYSLSHES